MTEMTVPSINLPLDQNGLIRTDNPVVTGKSTPQALVHLYADGKLVGTGKAGNSGDWAILTDSLSEGKHTFTATQTDFAGVLSAASTPVHGTVSIPSDGIKFSITSLNHNGISADQAYIQNMLDDSAARLSEVFDATMTIPLSVTVKTLGDNVVASAGAYWKGLDEQGNPIVDGAVLSLSDQKPSLFERTELANPYTTYMHEMLHILGFTKNVQPFANLVVNQGDDAYFVGANATAINGGPVRLHSGLSHLYGSDDLMGTSSGGYPQQGASEEYTPLSNLDIAILKDIGWTTKPVLVSADGHTFIAGSGKAGFDQVRGTDGLDTFFINQSRSAFTGQWATGEYVLSNKTNGTSHNLGGIERIKFADATVALDIDGTGGQVYRLYKAVFGREPDAAGMGFWIKGLDDGMSLAQAADLFVTSNEFKTLYGVDPAGEEIVTKLYANVLHREPDQPGFDYWLPIIEKDPTLIEEVLVAFSESAENKEQVAKIIGNGFEYEPYV